MNQDCRLPNTKRPFDPGGGDTPAPPRLPGEKTAQLRLVPGTTRLDRVLGEMGSAGTYRANGWVGMITTVGRRFAGPPIVAYSNKGNVYASDGRTILVESPRRG